MLALSPAASGFSVRADEPFPEEDSFAPELSGEEVIIAEDDEIVVLEEEEDLILAGEDGDDWYVEPEQEDFFLEADSSPAEMETAPSEEPVPQDATGEDGSEEERAEETGEESADALPAEETPDGPADPVWESDALLPVPEDSDPELAAPGLKAADLSEAEVIDLNCVYPFGDRTRDAVIRRYSAAVSAGASYINGNASTYYDDPCSVSAPYRAGRLTQDTLAAMTAAADYFRWLSGCLPLAGDATQLVSLQKAALVRNFSYAKQVNGGRPSDMDAGLWREGASQQVDLLAHHSAPFDAVRAMVNTGYSLGGGYWTSLEDRVTLLDPALSLIRFGYAGDVAVGMVRERGSRARGPYTAFPSPGWMPAELIDPSLAAWSFRAESGTLTVPDLSGLKVVVENLTGGGYYTCSEKSGRLTVSDDGTIAFLQPSPGGSSSYAGKTYRVTVRGLTDASTGQEKTVTYTVSFVSILPRVTSRVSGYSFEYSGLVLGTWAKDAGELKKAAAVLPRKVTVLTDTGTSFVLNVTGLWKLDEKKGCFCNAADAAGLPPRLSDPGGVLRRIEIPYRIADSTETWRTGLSFPRDPAVVGGKADVTVSRWDVGYNRSRVYRIRTDGAGGYTGKMCLDSAVSECFDRSTYSEYGHVFHWPVTAVSQAGTYIGVCFFNQFSDEAYVTPPEEFAVSRPGVSYNTYVNGRGWTGSRSDGAASGLSSKTCPIAAFRVMIRNRRNLGVRYSYAWRNSGWTTWKYNHAISGAVSGRGPAAEAVRMKLTGSAASEYDLYYCVYLSGTGWTDWAKNGDTAGRRGSGKTIRGLRVRLRKKR